MMRNPWGCTEWKGAWSDNSSMWTPQLRLEQKCVAEDDGTFHIPYTDFIEQYDWTSVAVDNDDNYKRFGIEKLFAPFEDYASFVITLEEDALLANLALDFTISVSQQGDRLKKYKRAEDPWEPSMFSIALICAKTGRFLATSNGERFTTSLVYEAEVLPAGNYVVTVIPVWNKHANEDIKHKTIYLEILCPVNTNIREMNQIDSEAVFNYALKKHAQIQDKKKRQNIRGIKNGGGYHIACLEVENLWIGYIYTHNGSQQDFTVNLTARC